VSDKASIFRQVSLDRLSSPEQLDQLVQVVRPRLWLFWAPLAFILLGALAWGFLGTVPATVTGRAILLQQGGLAEVSAAAPGRVTELLVTIGARVERGQAVARIAQPELVERQRQAQDRLAEAGREEQRLQGLLRQGADIQTASLQQQRVLLEQQQRAADERGRILAERATVQTALLAQGLVTRQTLLGTQAEATAARLESENTRVQVRQLALRQLEERKQAESQLSQARAQVAEARRAVESLAETARLTTVVESPYAGRVVEVRVTAGALVSPGAPLVAVEPAEGGAEGLAAALYLPASEGKKVSPGMAVHISPATVRREEYGYLVGEVTFVSDYPATPQSMRSTLQNEELVRQLSGSGAPIELRAKLLRADTASGYRWSSSSGPPLKVTAGTLAEGEVVVRRQPPITLVIPALRRALGVY
jgi:HlyD family secretion protein